MRLFIKLTESVQPAYILLALSLAAVAGTVPIWLGFGGPVQAKPASGLTGGVAWNGGSNPTPTPTLVISTGAKWHGAEGWHNNAAAYRGSGVKAGVIDASFDG